MTTDEPTITIHTIKQCAPTISQYMNRDALAPYLMQQSILSYDEMYRFQNANNSPSESSNYLIKVLETKHPSSAQKLYWCFQMETEHSGHLVIVETLRNTALRGNCVGTAKQLANSSFFLAAKNPKGVLVENANGDKSKKGDFLMFV